MVDQVVQVINMVQVARVALVVRVVLVIEFINVYGLHGLNNQIIEKTWDVTPDWLTDQLTDYHGKVEQYSVGADSSILIMNIIHDYLSWILFMNINNVFY